MRHPIITALVAALLAGTAPAADTTKPDSRSVTLRDLGYPDGVTLSGIAARQDIFFPLPAWVPIGDLKLEARLTGNLAEGQRASVQVQIDDNPRWTGGLSQQYRDYSLSMALSRTDTRQAFTKASIIWGAQWTENRCVDQRLPGGFVTLSPDSAITYSIDPKTINSVRAAWSALGPRVHLLLPSGALSPTQFQAAVALAGDLLRQGRLVTLSRLPRPDAAAALSIPDNTTGSIVLATKAEIEALGTAIRALPAKADLWHLRDADGGADIALLPMANGMALALLDGIDGEKLQLLTGGWSPLADTGANRVSAADTQPANRIRTDDIPFAALGLGQGVQELVDRAEWPLRLDYTQVPHGQRPAALDIELASGSTLGDRPQLLHVFVNNILLRSVSLPEGGKVQRVSVPLPDGLLGRSNAIRIVLQRQPSGGDCREAPLASPAQILPGSRVTLTPDTHKPSDFYGLSPAMAKGAMLLVTRDHLADTASINLAARIAADLVPAQAPLSVMISDGNSKLTTPFIQLPGASLPGAVDLPVRLDGGAVSVKDRSGQTLLDVSGTAGLITAQLAELDGIPGLTLTTADGKVPADLPRLAFDRGNVAFADISGLLMAFDTTRDRAVRVVVADDAGWADWLDRFRIMLVLGAWGLLTLVGVGALRRWYRNRAPKV